MKKYALGMLLLVCFLISLPVAAVDFRSTEVSNSTEYLQTPGITLFSFPEEITINLQGEVPEYYLTRETNSNVIENINFNLLEFTNNSNLNDGAMDNTLEILCKSFDFIFIHTNKPDWLGGKADLFCYSKQSMDLLHTIQI
ncbi:MAG: hypothetical protein PF518_04865 [Spirochaetaceae bacterium]|nr:hypothetical protein [Spirochaetaceae bacterium]